MSEPEADVLAQLLERIATLRASLADDLAWMEAPPRDADELETMASHRRSASRAALKSFEQIEDQLSRAFRVVPKLLGEDTARWYTRDHADFMEKLGILDDAAQWMEVVKLRNELVHDYPLDRTMRFRRLIAVLGFLPLIETAHQRLASFVATGLQGRGS